MILQSINTKKINKKKQTKKKLTGIYLGHLVFINVYMLEKKIFCIIFINY